MVYVCAHSDGMASLSCLLTEADGFNAAGKANVDSKIAEAPARNKKKEQVAASRLPSLSPSEAMGAAVPPVEPVDF